MGVSFFLAGCYFGLCAFMAFYYARCKNWTKHRSWVLRSFAQVLSVLLYRYWYVVVASLGLYPVPDSLGCNEETGICSQFVQPFDVMHAWTYWLTAAAVAEVLVCVLPDEQKATTTENVLPTECTNQNDGMADVEAAEQDNSKEDKPSDQNHSRTYGEDPKTETRRCLSSSTKPFLAFNSVAVSLAVIAIGCTITIFAS